jgi:hypothetical protein
VAAVKGDVGTAIDLGHGSTGRSRQGGRHGKDNVCELS